MEPLPLPSTLWIELTSRCPFDCKFCSRRLRRGDGEHMEFDLYRSLLAQLRRPAVIRLNYSGESVHYPRLEEAVRLARATGAVTELVTALASLPEPRLAALSGLDRLTVSLHTLDAAQFRAIYGLSDLDAMRRRLAALAQGGGRLDLAFVAMRENLSQLPRVAAYAQELGIADIFVQPVLRRDPIPEAFAFELDQEGRPSREFRSLLEAAIEEARAAAPGVRVVLPPPGCEQNPCGTVHVLAGGDVVSCEARDALPLGNLRTQTLAGIWHGEPYRRFREAWRAGVDPQCRLCPWQPVWLAEPLAPVFDARNGPSAQLLAGWHQVEPENGLVWSHTDSALLLGGGRRVRVRGILTPKNSLGIYASGRQIGRLVNRSEALLPFDKTFPADAGHLRFAAARPFRAAGDLRQLGFALQRAEVIPELPPLLGKGLKLLERALAWADTHAPHRPGRTPLLPEARPGLSVVIPERGNRELLGECLAALARALAAVSEPAEVIASVNGSPPPDYAALARRFPQVRWLFARQPLGFVRAVARGLSRARHDWVYLLNSDMTLEPGALTEVLRRRGPNVFAIASQIFFKDAARKREETNWTDFRLRDGLVEIFDAEPPDDAGVRGNFYAGGGSSLFRKTLLARVVRATTVYEPFYWEDVEWSAVARRLGFEVWFAPASRAWHAHRATVSRFYPAEEIERVWKRNAVIFQLRNLPGAAPLPSVFAHLRTLDERSLREMLRPKTVAALLQARLRRFSWPLPEECLYNCRAFFRF